MACNDRTAETAGAVPVPLTFYELAGTLVDIMDGPLRSDRLMAIWKMCADESYDTQWYIWPSWVRRTPGLSW